MTAFNPDWCIRPGVTLQEWCEQRGTTFALTARRCRRMSLEMFEGIVAGTVEIRPEHAGALQAGTGISAKTWLALEANYRAGLAAGRTEVV